MVNIISYFFVRKTNDTISIIFQFLFSNCIQFLLFAICMIFTIYFNNKLFFQTNKINDEIINYLLSAKFDSQLFSSNLLPEYIFCFSVMISLLVHIIS